MPSFVIAHRYASFKALETKDPGDDIQVAA